MLAIGDDLGDGILKLYFEGHSLAKLTLLLHLERCHRPWTRRKCSQTSLRWRYIFLLKHF